MEYTKYQYRCRRCLDFFENEDPLSVIDERLAHTGLLLAAEGMKAGEPEIRVPRMLMVHRCQDGSGIADLVGADISRVAREHVPVVTVAPITQR